MKSIRIGNDINVVWSLMRDDAPFSLEGLSISLYLHTPYGRHELSQTDYSVEGNRISWTFFGRSQRAVGKYSLILVVNKNERGMVTTDACDFVNLVDCSCKSDGADACGVVTEYVNLVSKIDVGGSSYDDSELRDAIENLDTRVAAHAEDIVNLQENKADKSELTELSAEVGKLPTKEYVDNAVANAGGGGSGDDTMTRILAGATPYICYRKIDGTIGFWDGYFVGTNHRQQTDIVEILFGGLGATPNASQFLNGWTNLEKIYPLMNGSGCTDLSFAFQNDAKLKDLSMLKEWDVSKVTSANSCFAGCAPEILPIENWDVSKIANMDLMFKNYQGIDVDFSRWTNNVVTTLSGFMRESLVKMADLHNISTEKCTTFEGAMRGCANLQWLDIRGWSCVSATSLHAMFNGCKQLTTLVGDTSVEEVISQDIKVLDGYTATSTLSIKESSIPLNRASLRALINGLADMTETGATLPIGSANIAKLTSDDIAVATAKGWTIS